MKNIIYHRGFYCNHGGKFNLKKKKTATSPSHLSASYVSPKFSRPYLLFLLYPNLGQQKEHCRHLLHLQHLRSQQIQLADAPLPPPSDPTTSASISNSTDGLPPSPPDLVRRTRSLPLDPTPPMHLRLQIQRGSRIGGGL